MEKFKITQKWKHIMRPHIPITSFNHYQHFFTLVSTVSSATLFHFTHFCWSILKQTPQFYQSHSSIFQYLVSIHSLLQYLQQASYCTATVQLTNKAGVLPLKLWGEESVVPPTHVLIQRTRQVRWSQDRAPWQGSTRGPNFIWLGMAPWHLRSRPRKTLSWESSKGSKAKPKGWPASRRKDEDDPDEEVDRHTEK